MYNLNPYVHFFYAFECRYPCFFNNIMKNYIFEHVFSKYTIDEKNFTASTSKYYLKEKDSIPSVVGYIKIFILRF